METPTQEQSATQQMSSNKKTVIKTIGIIILFYVVATIIGGLIPEGNFKAQFILMIFPAIATILYGYWAAIRENYLVLKVVFAMLFILVALELVSRIISRI